MCENKIIIIMIMIMIMIMIIILSCLALWRLHQLTDFKFQTDKVLEQSTEAGYCTQRKCLLISHDHLTPGSARRNRGR